MTQGQTVQSVLSILREGKDALARCDRVRLEEIFVLAGALSQDDAMALHLQCEGRTDVDVFARLLELTKENVRVIRGSRHLRTVDLEYQASGRRALRGATY
jgi:hypothetical protein